MVFLIFGDIFAAWIFPALLAIVTYLPLLAYLLFCFGTDTESKVNAVFLFIAFLMIVWHVACRIGIATPHLRETPRALMGYMVAFVRLVLWIELFCVGMHYSLWRVMDVLIGQPQGWTITLTVGGLLLGALLLECGAVRTFLYTPLPESAPQPIRGHDLGTSDDVSWRAWLDN